MLRVQATNSQDSRRVHEEQSVEVEDSAMRRVRPCIRCQHDCAVESRRVDSLKSTQQHPYDQPRSVDLMRMYNGQNIETISAELEKRGIGTISSYLWTGLGMILLIHYQNHDGAFALMKCKMNEGKCTDREVWEVMAVKLLKYFLITRGREELLQLALEIMKRALPRDEDQWQRSMVAYDLLSAIHAKDQNGFSISKELFIKYLSKIFPNEQGKEALWLRTIQALDGIHSFLGASKSGIDELFTFYKIWPAEKNVEDKIMFWAARIDEIGNAKYFNPSGLWHMHYYKVHNFLLEGQDFCCSACLSKLGWEKLAILFIKNQDCKGVCLEMMNATVFCVRKLYPNSSDIWGRVSELYCLESERLGTTLDGSLVLKYFQKVAESPDRYQQQSYHSSLFELFTLCSHHSSSSVDLHGVLQVMNEIPEYERLSNVQKHKYIAELILQGMRGSVSFEKGGYAPGHKENHMKGIDAMRDCLRTIYGTTDEARSKGIDLCIKELEQVAFVENCSKSLDLVLETLVQFCSSASKKSDHPYIHTMLYVLMEEVTLLTKGGFRGIHTWIVQQLISFSIGNWELDAEELWREGARICIPHGLEVLENYVKPITEPWETVLSILKNEVKENSSSSNGMALCFEVYKKTDEEATYLDLGCSFLISNMPDQAIECFREQGSINPYEYCVEQLSPLRSFQNKDLVDLLRNSKNLDIKALGYAFCRAGKGEFAIQCMKLRFEFEFDDRRKEICFDLIKHSMMHNQTTEISLYLEECRFSLTFCQSSTKDAEKVINAIAMCGEVQGDGLKNKERCIDEFIQSLYLPATRDELNERKEESESTRAGSLELPLQSAFDQIMVRPENKGFWPERIWMIVVLEEIAKAETEVSRAEYLQIIKECLPEERLITTENMWDCLYKAVIANAYCEFVTHDVLDGVFRLTNAAQGMEDIDHWIHLVTDLCTQIVDVFSVYKEAEKNEILKKTCNYLDNAIKCILGDIGTSEKECFDRITQNLAKKLDWGGPTVAGDLHSMLFGNQIKLSWSSPAVAGDLQAMLFDSQMKLFIGLGQDKIAFFYFKATKPEIGFGEGKVAFLKPKREDLDLWMIVIKKGFERKNFDFIFRCLDQKNFLPEQETLQILEQLTIALLEAREFEQYEKCYRQTNPDGTVWTDLAVKAARAGATDVSKRALRQIKGLSNRSKKEINALLQSICNAPSEKEAHGKVTDAIRAVELLRAPSNLRLRLRRKNEVIT